MGAISKNSQCSNADFSCSSSACWRCTADLQVSLGNMAQQCTIFLRQNCSLFVTRFLATPPRDTMAYVAKSSDVVVLTPNSKCYVYSKCSERKNEYMLGSEWHNTDCCLCSFANVNEKNSEESYFYVTISIA